MSQIPVPQTLDAPPRLLFWDIDYVAVAACAFACGTIVAVWWFGLALAALAVWGWGRARAGGGVSRAFALVYWHTPFDLFRRVPASSRRHFVG